MSLLLFTFPFTTSTSIYQKRYRWFLFPPTWYILVGYLGYLWNKSSCTSASIRTPTGMNVNPLDLRTRIANRVRLEHILITCKANTRNLHNSLQSQTESSIHTTSSSFLSLRIWARESVKVNCMFVLLTVSELIALYLCALVTTIVIMILSYIYCMKLLKHFLSSSNISNYFLKLQKICVFKVILLSLVHNTWWYHSREKSKAIAKPKSSRNTWIE